MSPVRRLVASLVASVSLVSAAAPAFAEGRDGAEKREGRVTRPMTAQKFHTKLEAGLARQLAVIEKRLDARGATADQRAAVKAQLETSSRVVRRAAAEIEKDGVVTQEEAKAFHAVLQAERARVVKSMPAAARAPGAEPRDQRPDEKRPHRKDGEKREKGEQREAQKGEKHEKR